MPTPVGPVPRDPNDPDLWDEWDDGDDGDDDGLAQARFGWPIRMLALLVVVGIVSLFVFAR